MLPHVFDLVDDVGTKREVERLSTLATPYLQDRPVKITCGMSAPRHIQVLWGVEQLARSFSNSSIWDSNVIMFARNVVEFMFPPILNGG